MLAALPDTPQLQALDAAFAAAPPLAPDRSRHRMSYRDGDRPGSGMPGGAAGRIARDMRRLIERYREEAGLDRLALELALADALARIAPCPAEPARPDISQQEQDRPGLS